MEATAWVRAVQHLPDTRRAVNATVLDVAREIGRAAAMLAGVVAWGTLLLLLAA